MKIIIAALFLALFLSMPMRTRTGAGDMFICRHYDPEGFHRAIEAARTYPAQGRILAATSPHFLPAMSFTASLLKTAAEQDIVYDTVILIGPNHGGEGLPVIIGDKGWGTPFGIIEPDTMAAAVLANIRALSGRSERNGECLEEDHSLATVTSFIKYYLPDARIVSVMLSRGVTTADVDSLAGALNELGKDKNILLIGSIDFSHYLNIEETAQKDAETAEIISVGDYRRMEPLDSAHLDSPAAMALLMRCAELAGTGPAEHWDGVIMPESGTAADIGYSYHTYAYTIEFQ
ncbi:MAG: AmmeMemoRadiSam system protein B [Clostridiales bacterium]|jgi:AmmeMemoRadiSam system protein B|nr:AmmeMemoRadiSam system protein B [Clostridiales bacterium]